MFVSQDLADFIVDAETLCSLYGSWPTFHDAEVLSLALDRGTLPNREPSLVIRLWTSHFNNRFTHSVATLRFDNPKDLIIEDFNHQNVLMGIDFKPIGDMVHVKLDGIFGVDAAYRCRKVRVET